MSTAAPFSLDPSLRTLSTAALLKRYKRLSSAERQTLGFTRPATDAEIAGSTRPPGAPADFGGAVFPNPDGVKVSEDTESGIEPLRLPTGVSLQHQNFTGPTPADVSNPPQTQIAGPHVQTVQAKFGNAIDYDALAQKHGAEPSGAVDYDALAAKHGAEATSNEPPAAGPHVTMHPHNLVTGKPNPDFDNEPDTSGEFLGNLAKSAAKDIYDIGAVNLLNQVIKQKTGTDLAAKVGLHGAEMEKIPNKAAMIVIPALAGEFGAPEPVPGVRSAPAAATPAATESAIPPAARTALTKALTKFALKKIPGAHSVADAIQFAKDMGWTEEMAAKKAAPAAEAVPMTDGTPWGKPILEKPAPAVEPEPAATTPPAEPTPETSTPHGGGIPRTLSGESALRQVLTGQDNANLIKIAKSRGINVTQESQLKPGVADSKLINKIIDHFSDDELDGVRSQYLENTRMGKHDFGNIGPEAWKTMGMQSYFPDVKIADAALRRTQTAIATAEKAKSAPAGAPSPLQQKVSNLEDFIRPAKAKAAAKPAAAEPATPAKPAEEPDLVDQLQKSVDLAKPGDVFTYSDPELLMKRWGVDEASLKTGREQTRGMKPEQTEAQIERLSEAYKEGKPVEPIMETRGSDNRLIDADGRMRVVAAHRAGLKRIPIIVRKLQPIE